MADFGTLPTTVQSLLVAFYTGHSTMTQETRDLLPHHPEGSAKPNNSSRAKVCSSGSCDEQRRKVGEVEWQDIVSELLGRKGLV